MPWYMSPDITCKVLNRIANHYTVSNMQNLVSILDYATEQLWFKQEQYYKRAVDSSEGQNVVQQSFISK